MRAGLVFLGCSTPEIQNLNFNKWKTPFICIIYLLYIYLLFFPLLLLQFIPSITFTINVISSVPLFIYYYYLLFHLHVFIYFLFFSFCMTSILMASITEWKFWLSTQQIGQRFPAPTDTNWTWWPAAKTWHAYRRPSAPASSGMPPRRTHRRGTGRWLTLRWCTFTHPQHFSTANLNGKELFFLHYYYYIYY